MKKIVERILSKLLWKEKVHLLSKQNEPTVYQGIKKIRKPIGLFLAILMLVSAIPWNSFITVKAVESNLESVQENTSPKIEEAIDIRDTDLSYEVKEKREGNKKVFRKVDGSYEINEYRDIVHYKKDGKWEDIDNSLTYDEGKLEYENKKNNYKINLPKELKENKQIKLKYYDYALSWNILGINDSSILINDSANEKPNDLRILQNINQKVNYNNILESVDLEYILSGDRIKENIILNTYKENFELQFNFKMKNLQLNYDEDGNVFLINENEDTIINFESLYMIDQNNQISRDIDFRINSTEKDEFTLTIIPSDEWLQSEDRQYPVTIDPTLVVTSATFDNNITLFTKRLMGNDSTYSYTYDDYAKIGSERYLGGDYREYVGYVHIDLQDYLDKTVLTYANLRLKGQPTCTYSYCEQETKINLKESTNTIGEITAPTTLNRVYDYVTTDYTLPEIANFGTIENMWYRWDISKLMHEWKQKKATSGTIELRAELLKYDYYEYEVVIKFTPPTFQQDTVPFLSIGYVEKSGLNDYWSYQSQNAGMAGVGYTNDYLGYLTFVHNDYAPIGGLFTFGINHFYNSSVQENLGYGNGWRMNYHYEYGVVDDSIPYLIDGDGSKIYYLKSNSDVGNEYVAEDGTGNIITIDNGVITLTMKNGTTIKDINSNKMEITEKKSKDGEEQPTITVHYIDDVEGKRKISLISDEVGNQAEFIYDDNSDLNLDIIVIKRKNELGNLEIFKKIEYSYDESNNLRYITHLYPDISTTSNPNDFTSEGVIEYGYDEHNRLISAEYKKGSDQIDLYHNAVGYHYNSINQVDEIELYNYVSSTKELISTISVNYDFEQTTFTDEQGNSIHYTFDDFGHPQYIYDSLGNISSYLYDTNFQGNHNLNHKVTGIAKPINLFNDEYDQSNLLSNPSFDMQKEGYGNYNLFYWYDIGRNEDINNCEKTSTEKRYLGDLCVIFNGSSNLSILRQTIHLEEGENQQGLIGDTYTIGGWAKGNLLKDELSIWVEDNLGNSLPINRYSPERKAFIRLSFYKGVTLQESKDFDFNTDIVGWQYLRKDYKTQKEYDKIVFEVHYENPNMVYFDGFELYKVDYGTKYDYNDDGNVLEVETSSGKMKFYYESTEKNKVDYIITADGRRFDINYDVDCNAESVEIQNVKESFEYDDNGNVTLTKISNNSDENYFSSSTTYDATGQFIRSSKDEFGNQFDYEYDIVTGLLEKIYDQNNVLTDYEYDSFGRLTKVSKDDASTVYKYLDGKLDEIVVDDNYIYKFEYDGFGRIDKVKVAGTILMDYDYDIVTKNPDQENKVNYYKDRVKRKTYGNQDFIEFGYNDLDQVEEIYVNSTVNPRFSYTYNGSGNLKEYIDNRTGETYTYYYDSEGRIDQITDNNDNKIDYNYDAHNRLGEYNYSIDSFNRNVTYKYYENVDTYGLHESTVFGDSLNKKYFYDSFHFNRLKQVQLNTGIKTINKYIYYDDNNVDTSMGNATYRVNKISYTKPNYQRLSVYYEYDSRHNIKYIKVSDSDGIDEYYYDYDELNQLKCEDVSLNDGDNSYTKCYDYDSRGNITDVKTYSQDVSFYQSSSGNIQMYYNDDYKYDDLYYLEIGNAPSLTFTYYDTSSFMPTPILGMQTTLIYSNLDISTPGYYYREYTATDGWSKNITFRIVFKVGNPGPIEHIHYNYSDTWLDQLTGYDKIEDNGTTVIKGQEYLTYDAQGNPTTITKFKYNGTTYHHADLKYEGRQLIEIKIYSDVAESILVETISYEYNDQGIRISKTIGSKTTKYVVDGSKVLLENAGTNDVIYYTYDLDGSLISMNLNGEEEYFYLTNLQGDIIELVDINGITRVTYKYDAWGNIIDTKEYDSNGNKIPLNIAKKNPYRYRGYRYDEEIGYYYLQSRYYNPEIGRFINADGLLGQPGNIYSHNMYAYSGNNPVMRVDPSGYMFWDLLDVVGFGVSLIDFIQDPSLSTMGWLVLDTIGLLPAIPSISAYVKGGKYLSKVDEVGDGLKGVSNAVPSGKQYSNMFEATISGSSRSAHRNQANRQFFNALKNDPGFAKQVDDFLGYDTMKYMQSGKGKNLLNPSKDWVWHHPADRAGVIQLIPKWQHTSPLFQDVLHPLRKGGHAIFY